MLDPDDLKTKTDRKFLKEMIRMMMNNDLLLHEFKSKDYRIHREETTSALHISSRLQCVRRCMSPARQRQTRMFQRDFNLV